MYYLIIYRELAQTKQYRPSNYFKAIGYHVQSKYLIVAADAGVRQTLGLQRLCPTRPKQKYTVNVY